MAENEDSLVQGLKEKGLSCSKLQSLERNKLADAKLFRSLGFVGNLAQREEASLKDLKELRQKVCKLR